MIDSKDLRIGNLVKYLSTKDGSDIYQTIQEVSIGFVKCSPLDCKHCGYIGTPEKLYQIELTEEWLKRFGILKNEIETEGGLIKVFTDGGEVWSGLGSYGLGYGFEFKISYVHQLQNLIYSLTGKELTLKQQ